MNNDDDYAMDQRRKALDNFCLKERKKDYFDWLEKELAKEKLEKLILEGGEVLVNNGKKVKK